MQVLNRTLMKFNGYYPGYRESVSDALHGMQQICLATLRKTLIPAHILPVYS